MLPARVFQTTKHELSRSLLPSYFFPLPSYFFPFPSLYRVHALNAMDAAVAHRLAAPDMCASELTAGLQKHLDAQKENR